MSIEYVEIRDSGLVMIGIVDSFQSIIWHSVYYGVGDFEIYAPATANHVALLVENNYVTRNNDLEVGIIEHVNIAYDLIHGRMIIATGRFVKSILDRRYIYHLDGHINIAVLLSGNVEIGIRQLVADNAISCSFDHRRDIELLALGALSSIPDIIVDENGNPTTKQVAYENLLTYTESVLKEYKMSAIITLDTERKRLLYSIYRGADRSIDNSSGNDPVIFSQEFDNLSGSEYDLNTTAEKTAALIGGQGEGIDKFFSMVAGNETGIARRETYLEASSLSKKYKDESGTEQEYTNTEYKKMLDSLGKQNLAKLVKVEKFSGQIETRNTQYVINEDFALGDIVTVQDTELGKYINVRVNETTEAQDENGYSVDIVYG